MSVNHMHAWCQKNVFHPLDLALQMVGIESVSSGRAAKALNCYHLSSLLYYCFLKYSLYGLKFIVGPNLT